MPLASSIRIKVTRTASGAGLQVARTEPVPEGEQWVVERHTYEGSAATSGGNTRARTYIDGRGYNLYLKEQDGPSAGALYADADRVILSPSERLAVEWDEAASGNVLTLHVVGYRIYDPGQTI